MRTLWVLGGLAVLGFTLCSPHHASRPDFGAPPQLANVREIGFPGRPARGSFRPGFLKPAIQTEELFASRVAPDQSVLTLAGDTRADWPLTRVKNWWTPRPIVEVLNVPGWSAADAKSLREINVDLEISPNGRNAVALVNALWEGKTARQPDTIITVVDLEKWQVLETLHTSTLAQTDFRGAWLSNDRWIVLQGMESTSRRRNLLFSIPGLERGPECTSTRLAIFENSHSAQAEALRQRNDAACREVVSDAGAESLESLEARIYTGQPVPPEPVELASPGQEQAQRREDYDHWSQFQNELYWNNAPFESSAHRWYGLYDARLPQTYELARFAADGQRELSKVSRILTCGNRALAEPNVGCGCRVKDVSETQASLLAYCQTMPPDEYGLGLGDYQWLAVFRSDDLAEVGLVPLPSKKHVREMLAVGDGNAYLLTVTSGEMLRVYAVSR